MKKRANVWQVSVLAPKKLNHLSVIQWTGIRINMACGFGNKKNCGPRNSNTEGLWQANWKKDGCMVSDFQH